MGWCVSPSSPCLTSTDFLVRFCPQIAATLTNPFDVVKTRRQAGLESNAFPNSSSSTVARPPILTKTFAIIFDIAKKEGMPGLMRGLAPRLAKVGPACGIMIASYEGLGRMLSE